jgi:hypothetical protein
LDIEMGFLQQKRALFIVFRNSKLCQLVYRQLRLAHTSLGGLVSWAI